MTQRFNERNIDRDKFKNQVEGILKGSNDPISVTQITARVMDDPEWDDRIMVQDVLADLVDNGLVAQTPDWKYVYKR